MQKAIYKIENKLNHKIYIGQSMDPERRFREHCGQKQMKYSSLIQDAIQKYGKENFTFEVLGWFEDYNEKEIYYISFYRSLAPYGYNLHPGGNDPPHYKGELNPHSTITQQIADKIIEQLLDYRIPKKTIVANNKVTADIVRHINEGDSWKKDGLTYPLRPNEAVLDKYRALYVQWLCCTSTIPLNHIGAKVGWARSSAKMINWGKNHFRADLKYPIRNNAEYNKIILSQEACIDYLHFGE